jgi:hypothetical protein
MTPQPLCELNGIGKNVGEFGCHATIPKEVVVLVKPPHQKVTAFVPFIGFVMLSKSTSRIHLTPMGADIQNYQQQESLVEEKQEANENNISFRVSDKEQKFTATRTHRKTGKPIPSSTSEYSPPRT